MSVQKEGTEAFLEKASEAAELIRECAGGGNPIYVFSHLDADGLASAGIIGKSLARLGTQMCIRIKKWIDESVVHEIVAEKPSLTVFTDLGAGDLDLLKRIPSDHRIVVLDHHQLAGESPSTLVHVNPHLHGVDGSRDLSGSGVAYFVAKALDGSNVDLACIAVVGALGDLQDKYQQKLGGVNELIVEDAIKSEHLEIETDILLFGRETRPIHKALAYTTNPFIPGISGEEDKSLAFLAGLGITPKHGAKWRALRDLSEEEKRKMFSSLADYLVSKGYSSDVAISLIGSVYTLRHEDPWTPLRDAREFSVLLNAAGRMDKPSLGVAVCMGDRGTALEEANTVLGEYRKTIIKYLDWLNEKPSRIEELSNIYVVRGGSFIKEKMIGTVSSILSSSLGKLGKPIVAYSTVSEEDLAKVSARASDILTGRGLNLGEILRIAAEGHMGRGGGHNIAAGAQVPIKHTEAFIRLVDELVKKQLDGETLGS